MMPEAPLIPTTMRLRVWFIISLVWIAVAPSNHEIGRKLPLRYPHFDDGRATGGQRLLERSRKLLLALHDRAKHTICLGHHRKIGIAQSRAARASRIMPLLVHADRAIGLVVDDDDD